MNSREKAEKEFFEAYIAQVVNGRGETRAERNQRYKQTAEKLAAVLTEHAASYTEIDLLVEKAKELLYVTNRQNHCL